MMLVFAVTFALIIIGQLFLFKKTPATPTEDGRSTNFAEQRDHDSVGNSGHRYARLPRLSPCDTGRNDSCRNESGKQRSRDHGRKRSCTRSSSPIVADR